MTINSDSRYITATVSVVTDRLGREHQDVRVPIPAAREFNFSYYQVLEHDTPDGMAFNFFGDGSMWWELADANPEILDWTDIPVGTVLRVPYV